MKAIMYHYIRMSNPDLPYFRYLSVSNFAKQLDYFKNKYSFVKYNEFTNFLHHRKYNGNLLEKILLTFDDGLVDHYTYVLPELIKRDIFGFFYIPTGIFTNSKALDVHRIHYLLGRFGGEYLIEKIKDILEPQMLVSEHYIKFKDNVYKSQNNDFYTDQFKKIFNYFISYEYRKPILDSLVSELSCDEEIHKATYLNKDQLEGLYKNKMIIGSHSINHYVLSKLSTKEQNDEINQSFDFLSEYIDPNIKSFCYPYGGFETFTTQTEQILNDAGCQFSFNVDPRNIKQSDWMQRPQALPRFDCNRFQYGSSSIG